MDVVNLPASEILLKAENARLKMLLGYVLSVADGFGSHGSYPDETTDPLLLEAKRYASGDSGLEKVLTDMALSAINAERKRCLEIVQYKQYRNGFHKHENDEVGHYSTSIVSDIRDGVESPKSKLERDHG